MTNEVVLRCACCGLPFAYVRDGCLVIESRHHGEKHENIIPLLMLPQLRQLEGAPNEKREK